MERFEGQVWDPASGLGRIADAAAKAGLPWICTDLVDRGRGGGRDFLAERLRPSNIVTNPPFGIAEKFVAHAIDLAERKVAMLLPVGWLQGNERSRWLATTPLRRVWFIAPRPSMPPRQRHRGRRVARRRRGRFCVVRVAQGL